MDISSLRERRIQDACSVSELNSIIKNILEADRGLKAVSVYGEISNFTHHTNGHMYFTLKDNTSQIRAVMFRSMAEKLAFRPENGMKVNVRGSLGVYAQGGTYQLYINTMSPDGIGSLYLAYERLKEKLYNEGLFSEAHKKILPRTPKKIGVITSPTGAAVRDIINVTGRRYPYADIYLYPSLVQGDGAENNLIEAVEYFNNSGLVDVIIIGRGGGSIEDLWAFNSERLARTIFKCDIPVISAVGHETDFTICDFVSDKRAPTPSAAAELAVPDYRDLLITLDTLSEKVLSLVNRFIERKEERVTGYKTALTDVDKIFMPAKNRLNSAHTALTTATERYLEKSNSSLSVIAGKLQALSPLAVLSRGYSLVYSGDTNIKSVAGVEVGEIINVRLTDGELGCEIREKRNNK